MVEMTKTPRQWFRVVNRADAAELHIYEQIGKDWFDNSGVTAKEFSDALKGIPSAQPLTVFINSPGGNVWDGLAIYHALKARGNVTTVVDGIAASIASVIALAGKEVRIPANALFMVHDPSGAAMGTAEDMLKMAEALEKHAEVIANIYVEKTGKPFDEVRSMMREETWLTGTEAAQAGFADTVTDEISLTASATNFDLSRFRRAPVAAVNLGGQPSAQTQTEQTPPTMPTNTPATAEAITPAPVALSTEGSEVTKIKGELAAITAQLDAARRANVTREVQNAASEGRIPANQVDAWVTRAMKDETILNDLKSLPVQKPGEEPVSASVEVVATSIKDIEAHALRLKGAPRAHFLRKNADRLAPVLNTNTVGSDLKRVTILDAMLRAFAKRVMPLNRFSTVFQANPLQGTDEVVVPFYDLDSSSSTDWNASNGYVLGNTATTSRKVTVNKRKYQGMSITSSEFRRQPYLNVMQLATLKAEKLAYDVFADVLSVVVNANFSTIAHTGLYSAFTAAKVIDIKASCDTAEWPEAGRTLFLDTAYFNNLLKDSAIQAALNYGGVEAIRNGQIPELFGFGIVANPNIPGNSENLTGFVSFPSAILVASAPIEPAPDVRAQLSGYEVVTDPETGISLEYRRWGNPDMDDARETVEVNYGYAKGNASALQRIRSAIPA